MKRERDSACAILAIATLFPRVDEPIVQHIASAAPADRRGHLLRMDRLCGLSLCVADQVFFDASAAHRFDPATTAVVVGSAYGCHKSDEEFFRGRLAGNPSPRLFSYTLPSSPVGEVSIHHGLLGPGLGIVTGRTAGLEAIEQAQELLLSRQASACLVLACESSLPAVVERPEDAALQDGAVALLLTLGEAAGKRGQIIDSATAFRASDPAAAALLCLEELRERVPACRGATLCCDSAAHNQIGVAIPHVQAVATPPCGAVSPVAVLAGLSSLPDERSTAGHVVLSVDPSGLAAAVLWRL